MKYRLTRRARQDLLNIWRYIAEDNEPPPTGSSTCSYIISGSWETLLMRGAGAMISGRVTAVFQWGST
jgi:hypothetical protein